jgi:hypothetical protein
MNWSLDNLTPKQRDSIFQSGYVGAFTAVFLPRLLMAEPPILHGEATVVAGTPSTIPSPNTQAVADPQLVVVNNYVPLALTDRK